MVKISTSLLPFACDVNKTNSASQLANKYTYIKVYAIQTHHPSLAVQGKFLLVSNRIDFGHLVDADGFDTSRLHSEMWQIFTNPWDWERRYIHENYSRALDESIPVAEVGGGGLEERCCFCFVCI